MWGWGDPYTRIIALRYIGYTSAETKTYRIFQPTLQLCYISWLVKPYLEQSRARGVKVVIKGQNTAKRSQADGNRMATNAFVD